MRPTVNGLHRTGPMTQLAEPLISRRTLLLGTLGLWFGVLVAACTGRNPSALSSPSASASASSSSLATPACVVTPAQTEGPYFVDERLNRSDITTDPNGSEAFLWRGTNANNSLSVNGGQVGVAVSNGIATTVKTFSQTAGAVRMGTNVTATASTWKCPASRRCPTRCAASPASALSSSAAPDGTTQPRGGLSVDWPRVQDTRNRRHRVHRVARGASARGARRRPPAHGPRGLAHRGAR